MTDITERRKAEQALQESEKRLRALITASSEVVYCMSPDWSEMRLLYGRGFLADTEKPRRKWIQEYIPPEDQAHVTTIIHQAIRTKSIFELEHRVQRADGIVGWAFSRAVPIMDGDGEIIEWFGAASDVTERKNAEIELKKHRQQLEVLVQERTAELRQSEQNFRNSIENSPLGIRVVTAGGETLYANRSLLNIYGYSTADEMKNTPVIKRYTSESYAEHLERNARRIQGLPTPDNYEINIVREDGQTRCLKVYRREALWDGRTEFQCIYEDITERKDAQEKLKALSRRLLETQEDERRNIALELHDEFGQSLTALKIMLDMQTRLATGQLQSTLSEASKLTGEILQQVREFSLDLRPKILDDQGLLPALMWYLHRYTERTGIKVDFQHSGFNWTFSRDLSNNVYRIVQEALTNVVRHASADRVGLRLRANRKILTIVIEDNGSGFHMASQSVYESSGLEGMRERARLLGGRLIIDSAPGHGTHLLLEVPLNGHVVGRLPKTARVKRRR